MFFLIKIQNIFLQTNKFIETFKKGNNGTQ